MSRQCNLKMCQTTVLSSRKVFIYLASCVFLTSLKLNGSLVFYLWIMDYVLLVGKVTSGAPSCLLLLLSLYLFPHCLSSFRWYHGKLDRTIAEERLRQARTPGSYLIRESDRRPGSFVLSFLSMTSVVNHFRYDGEPPASRHNSVLVASPDWICSKSQFKS